MQIIEDDLGGLPKADSVEVDEVGADLDRGEVGQSSELQAGEGLQGLLVVHLELPHAAHLEVVQATRLQLLKS